MRVYIPRVDVKKHLSSGQSMLRHARLLMISLLSLLPSLSCLYLNSFKNNLSTVCSVYSYPFSMNASYFASNSLFIFF